MPRFSRTGLRYPAGAAQQGKVLHVPGADLDDVGIFRHQFQGVLVHGLGDDEQAGLFPHLLQGSSARPCPSLVAVRGGAGLVGAAPEDAGPGGLDLFGDGQGLGFAFHRAGAGHDHETAPAQLQAGQVMTVSSRFISRLTSL